MFENLIDIIPAKLFSNDRNRIGFSVFLLIVMLWVNSVIQQGEVVHFKNFREHIHGEPFHTTILKGIEVPKLPQTFAGDHILLLSWYLIRTEEHRRY